ncbi:hypothetical protein F1640_10485 [Novosphingobium sp. NBM11]|jgi:hypothetical protein|uniref:hypothetical protein n=1 Tax=unclassified Novosphingobium TaxID=2644732 RepID=UPI0010BDFA46|nr:MULTISPECIES: hypothetical protein [unclassified Novosphingobium]MBF5090434.1 hypothetical protein [Novosphingobium sp. NBM11]QCI94027.1 hypothetical protein FA702_11030 [Novosphingobium sp. EMRT-2]
MSNADTATLILTEMREFASFSAAEQRYIRRSLDVGLGRQDAFRLWARSGEETASIRAQYVIYQDLKTLRTVLPEGPGPDGLESFMGKLMRVTAFDLGQERLSCFSAYRFLYERLLGAEVRPWLPGAFCGAAALPQIRPERRKGLLQSISEAAATAPGWSPRAPKFYPEFVELEAA